MTEYKTFIKEVYNEIPARLEGEHSHDNYRDALLTCMEGLYLQSFPHEVKVKTIHGKKETYIFIDNELFAKIYPAY